MKGLKLILVSGALALVAGAFAQGGYMPNQLIVKFKPGSQAMESRVHAAAGTQVIQKASAINWTLVRIPAGKTKAQIKAIYNTYPNYVTMVTENPIVELDDTVPNDPDYATKQWGPPKVSAPKMWDRSQGKTSTIVAILDTGVDIDHPDLVDNLLPGSDPGEGDNNPDDEDGHGTHCAGIAGAVGNNGIGIAGMGWKNKIMPVKVFGSVGGFAVATGITYATDHGANVISMSIKITDFQALRDAVDYAWGKNVLLVASAGNANTSVIQFPSGYEKVMAVASSDPNDGKSDFSNFGNWVDVTAPGSNIWSTYIGGGYESLSGTSMSTPMVAGLAGVLFSEVGITATNQQIWDLICNGCDKPAIVNYCIHGRINAAKSINLIQQYKIVGTNPNLATMFIGIKMTGDAALLPKKDGKAALVTSKLESTTGSTAAVIVDFTLTDPLSSFIEPQIRVSSKTDVSTTQMIFIYNNTTKKWDFLRSNGLGKQALDVLVELPAAMGNYITAQGKIRLLVRTHVPVTRGRSVASYRLHLDQVLFEGKVKL